MHLICLQSLFGACKCLLVANILVFIVSFCCYLWTGPSVWETLWSCNEVTFDNWDISCLQSANRIHCWMFTSCSKYEDEWSLHVLLHIAAGSLRVKYAELTVHISYIIYIWSLPYFWKNVTPTVIAQFKLWTMVRDTGTL